MGIPCIGLNGGPGVEHNWAFSFQVATADQAEQIVLERDRRHGGEESHAAGARTGGESWQITPIVLTHAFIDPDPAAAKRAFDAMMPMRKIDIATIEAARRG